jgi:hypothetical protein
LTRDKPISIALFQGLSAQKVAVPKALARHDMQLTKSEKRDPFWDQIITVAEVIVPTDPRYEMIETGTTGSALPLKVRASHLSSGQIQAQRDSRVDPHIPHGIDHELSWTELESFAICC